MIKNKINVDLSLIGLGLFKNKRIILGLQKKNLKHNYYNFFFFRKKFDTPLIYFFITFIIVINVLSLLFFSTNLNLVLTFNKSYGITPVFSNVNLKSDNTLLLVNKLFSFLSLI